MPLIVYNYKYILIFFCIQKNFEMLDQKLKNFVSWESTGFKNLKFELSDSVHIPNKLEHYIIDKKNHLFIDQTKPSWISCNEFTSDAVQFFQQEQGSIKNAIRLLIAKWGISEQKARNEIETLLTNLADSEFLETNIKFDTNNQLTTLHLYITEKCNLQCKHCYMGSGPNSTKGLSRQQLKDIITCFSSIHKNSKVTFTGGEPFIRKSTLFYLAELAHCKGLTTNLITNGTLISKNDIDKINNLFDSVKISIDGPTQEIHEYLRGKGSFIPAVNSLILLDETNIDKTLGMTLPPEYIEDVENKIESFIKSLSLKNKLYVSLSMEILTTGRGASFKKNDKAMKKDAERRLLRVIDNLWERGWVRDINTPMFRKLNNCGIGRNISIRADGSIMPCALPYINIGNIHNHSLQFISDNLEQIRIDTSVDNIPECSGCPIRYICLGGCRMENLKKRGSYTNTGCTEKIRKNKIKELMYRPSLSMRDI